MFNKKEYNRQYQLKNKERIAIKHKEWIRANQEYLRQYRKEWHKIYYAKNKEKIDAKNKLYAQTHKAETVKNVQRYVQRNKEKVAEYNKIFSQTVEGKYRTTKHNAKRRGYSFQLTIQEFNEISSNPCSYCGGNAKRGVDRINNSIGYTKENSVACCKLCNRMKWILSKEEFINHIKKICKNLCL